MGMDLMNITRVFFATIILLLLSASSDAKSHHRRYKKHSRYFDASKYKGDLPSIPASYIDGFPKEICPFKLDQRLAYDVETDHKFAVVSKDRFNSSHPCGSKIKVSCVEPFEDLGGPTNICQTKKAFTLIVIAQDLDELGDDLLLIPSKIFSKLANPPHEFIRVALHPTKSTKL